MGKSNITRRVPIDFAAVAKEAGMRKGKLVHSRLFGWGVYAMSGPQFRCASAPPMLPGETELRIVGKDWCFYGSSMATKHRPARDPRTKPGNHAETNKLEARHV